MDDNGYVDATDALEFVTICGKTFVGSNSVFKVFVFVFETIDAGNSVSITEGDAIEFEALNFVKGTGCQTKRFSLSKSFEVSFDVIDEE